MENLTIRYRAVKPHRRAEFRALGHRREYFFPHEIFYIPKCGPDAYKLASALFPCEPAQMVEVILYAEKSALEEFPSELFFDRELVWHLQDFGKCGQIATANLILREDGIYTTAHVSDIVQRISRCREHKTRIERVFKGWSQLLLNAILNFALETNVKDIYTPTSKLALEMTDTLRNPDPGLFERVYDKNPHELYHVEPAGLWWRTNVPANRERIVLPEIVEETQSANSTICLLHDTEFGIGHIDSDPQFAEIANTSGLSNILQMTDLEEKNSAVATYNVVGQIMNEVRPLVEPKGHGLGFHSFDHYVDSTTSKLAWPFSEIQKRRQSQTKNAKDDLLMCRQVDYRIKGYRPPQSRLTEQLSDDRLLFHNFEWLANAATSFENSVPSLVNGIVKVPIAFDDYALYKQDMTYEEWERMAESIIERNEFTAFSMHDCYAHLWLPHFERFLAKIRQHGSLRTVDQVAAQVTLASAL